MSKIDDMGKCTCRQDETTELVFILDRSGSMAGLEDDTIGGFNAMIAEQRERPGKCRATVVLFDHLIEVLVDDMPLESIGCLTRGQYWVRGCTALLDAVGSTIRQVNARQKSSLTGRPDHTIFVITTDGLENASKLYTLQKVRQLIEKRKRKNGWEFIFLGANIDAVKTAGDMGIAPGHAADYRASGEGVRVMYDAVGCALDSIRLGGALRDDWKADIDA